MKSSRPIIPALLILAVSCSNHDSVEDTGAAGDSSASITHEDGWTIISKEENGNPVYWFLAPDINGTSPAMYKKIINTRDKDEPAIKIVSECEAPKKLCEELGDRFKTISDKYR